MLWVRLDARETTTNAQTSIDRKPSFCPARINQLNGPRALRGSAIILSIVENAICFVKEMIRVGDERDGRERQQRLANRVGVCIDDVGVHAEVVLLSHIALPIHRSRETVPRVAGLGEDVVDKEVGRSGDLAVRAADDCPGPEHGGFVDRDWPVVGQAVIGRGFAAVEGVPNGGTGHR